MKIGIDLDGVVLDTEKCFRCEAELYDILKLKKNSIIDKTEARVQEKYSWSDDEKSFFINNYFVKSSKKSNVMPGAKEVINLLRADGHELILITARGTDIEEMKIEAEERLKKENIIFDKYYWATRDKKQVCKNENIDIMIDDFYINCLEISQNKIKTLYFRDAGIKRLEQNEYLKEVNTWGEIYREIFQNRTCNI